MGGLLQKLLLKDLRRCGHTMSPIVTPTLLPASEEGVSDVVRRFNSQKWSLLDVGSCYNPFVQFHQFDVTAIDIAPANQVSHRPIDSSNSVHILCACLTHMYCLFLQYTDCHQM